jgi:hypothetical protein
VNFTVVNLILKMFEQREPFQKIFEILRFYGLWGEISITHNYFANVAYFIFVIFYALMLFLSLLQINTMNEFLQFITIMPILIMVVISVGIFMRRTDRMKTIFELLTEMENASSKHYFDKTCIFLNNFFKLMTVSSIIFLLVFIFSAIFLNQLNFPMFIPESLAHHWITFYVYWIFQVS